MEESVYNIRFIKLHFELELVQDCVLPVSKASALRGGIGEMLLRSFCIRDRACEKCEFEAECIVPRTMYSKMEKKPAFMQSGDSVGYIVNCEDYREEYFEGECLKFTLTLFGKTLVYFNCYLQAVAALGHVGLGKYRAGYRITGVKNTAGYDLLKNGNIDMNNYRIETIADYVEYRMRHTGQSAEKYRMAFKTPASIKYRGENMDVFDMEAIVKALQRRLYILDSFEGIEGEDHYKKSLLLPQIVHQDIRPISVRRFSERKEQAMWLSGIKGEVIIEGVTEEMLKLLYAGEIIHVGKNTSFGFGRYVLHNV